MEPVRKFTKRQVAEILGVSSFSIFNLIRKGHLRAIRYPGLNRIYILEEDLLEYIRVSIPSKSQSPQIDASTVTDHPPLGRAEP